MTTAAIRIILPSPAVSLDPEVRFLNLACGLQLLGGRCQCDSSPFEKVAAPCEAQREPCILLDEQDRDPRACDQLLEDLEDAFDDKRREAHRWFVEHQQPGTCHQCARDRKHLLLPSA